MSIKKEELIKQIDRALRIEEETVPQVSKNISAAARFIEKDPKKRTEIEQALHQLADESGTHAELLLDLKKKILEGKKNVY